MDFDTVGESRRGNELGLANPARRPGERSAKLLIVVSLPVMDCSNNAWCKASKGAVNRVAAGFKDTHAMQVSAQVAVHFLRLRMSRRLITPSSSCQTSHRLQ
jgi:hypothetical protein